MQASAERIWTMAQEQLRSMLNPDTYNLWFSKLRACGQEQNSLLLEVANDFCEVWLKDNYMDLLEQVVGIASGRELQIKFKVAATASLGGNHSPTTVPVAKTKGTEPGV